MGRGCAVYVSWSRTTVVIDMLRLCASNVGENEIEHVPRHEEAKQLGKSNPPPPSAGSSIVLVVE